MWHGEALGQEQLSSLHNVAVKCYEAQILYILTFIF